jgi:hypothetical protein
MKSMARRKISGLDGGEKRCLNKLVGNLVNSITFVNNLNQVPVH